MPVSRSGVLNTHTKGNTCTNRSHASLTKWRFKYIYKRKYVHKQITCQFHKVAFQYGQQMHHTDLHQHIRLTEFIYSIKVVITVECTATGLSKYGLCHIILWTLFYTSLRFLDSSKPMGTVVNSQHSLWEQNTTDIALLAWPQIQEIHGTGYG
jgi:disulfide oxidoreductase YuzD